MAKNKKAKHNTETWLQTEKDDVEIWIRTMSKYGSGWHERWRKAPVLFAWKTGVSRANLHWERLKRGSLLKVITKRKLASLILARDTILNPRVIPNQRDGSLAQTRSHGRVTDGNKGKYRHRQTDSQLD